MSTFNGSYIAEPADFSTVMTEVQLIELLDDPGSPDAGPLANRWADLTVEQQTAFANVAIPIIATEEGIVNGYLRAGGFMVPSSAALIKTIVVALVDIDLRKRRGNLTAKEAEEEKASFLSVLAQIRDRTIDMEIEVAPADVGLGGGPLVAGITSSPRLFSRELLEDY